MKLKKRYDDFNKYIDEHSWALILTAVVLVLLMVLIEFLIGRLWICKCNYVLPWYGEVSGPGNSQHMFDWWSFSHVVHGMGYYLLLWLVARKMPVKTRFLFAVLIEVSWEILENSPLIINRYRTATFALDYYGDSIINSFFDVVSMSFGFLISRKLPWWGTVSLVAAMELFTLYLIRDNLVLNIVNLIYPTEAIKNWQAAGLNSTNLDFVLFFLKSRLINHP